MFKIVHLLFIYGLVINCFGQTTTIKVNRIFYENSFNKFDKIKFNFNGNEFYGIDTIDKTITVNNQFDTCWAIIGVDTLKFLTKFQSGGVYILKPGCCCAAFTLTPTNKAMKGTVKFKNILEKPICVLVAAGADTINAGFEKEQIASESAMCYFKPCSILMVETEYLNKKYTNWDFYESFDSLRLAQNKFILSSTFFHFLHGERIEIFYDKNSSSIKLKLMGYLSEEEYKNWGN